MPFTCLQIFICRGVGYHNRDGGGENECKKTNDRLYTLHPFVYTLSTFCGVNEEIFDYLGTQIGVLLE